jgi:hypothetical protein
MRTLRRFFKGLWRSLSELPLNMSMQQRMQQFEFLASTDESPLFATAHLFLLVV